MLRAHSRDKGTVRKDKREQPCEIGQAWRAGDVLGASPGSLWSALSRQWGWTDGPQAFTLGPEPSPFAVRNGSRRDGRGRRAAEGSGHRAGLKNPQPNDARESKEPGQFSQRQQLWGPPAWGWQAMSRGSFSSSWWVDSGAIPKLVWGVSFLVHSYICWVRGSPNLFTPGWLGTGDWVWCGICWGGIEMRDFVGDGWVGSRYPLK